MKSQTISPCRESWHPLYIPVYLLGLVNLVSPQLNPYVQTTSREASWKILPLLDIKTSADD